MSAVFGTQIGSGSGAVQIPTSGAESLLTLPSLSSLQVSYCPYVFGTFIHSHAGLKFDSECERQPRR